MRSNVSSYQSHASAIISHPVIGTEPIDSVMDTLVVGAEDSILQHFELSVTRSQLGSSSVWLRLTTNFQNVSGNTYGNNVLGVRDIKIVVEDHQRHEVIDTNIQIDSTRYAVSGDYRYGFIGAENDNEISGSGNSQNHSFRQYNPRLGRYMSLDPLAKDFPWNSPFAYAENDVIRSIDLEGRERYIMITNLATEKTSQIELTNAGKLGEGILYVTQSQNGLSSTFQAPLDIDNAGNISGGEMTRVPISYLDSKTQGKLIQNSSPLSMGAKSAIMKDIATPDIHLTKDEVRFGANVLDYGGLGVEIVGYGATVLGAPEVGIPLSRAGAAISGVGSGIKATMDAAEGDFTGATINAVGMGATGVANKGVDKLLKRADNGLSREILKRGNSMKGNVVGKAVSGGTDKENE